MGSLPSGAGALVGKRLDQYELLALLALGGTAEIYLARVEGTAGFEKYVVVKCLHDHLAYDREFVQMFLDEARLGAQLDHSNCVQTLGLGEQDGRYYLVMEYVAGMSLALMARRAVERVPRGYIPVPLVLGIAVQACQGLHYAHERQSGGRPLNLVHRDISPQNLVLTFEGVVKVVDFGIAKAEDRETATRSGTIKGKFAYMSPEQCQAKDIDRRTDVFALGVVVHELLTGRRLFKRGSAYDTYQAILECKVPTPSAQNHELDPALDPILMKALAKNPSQRYPSAEAFGEALTHYLHSRGKASGAGDIALFIDQHFGPEINDQGARMRELLAGRTTEAAGWDDDEVLSGSALVSSVSQVDELSQFEVIDDLDSGGASVSRAETQPPVAASDDELPAEATRIEMNPTARLAEMDERVRKSQQQAAVAPPPTTIPPPVAAPPARSRRPTPPTPPTPPSLPPLVPPVAAGPRPAVVPTFGAASPGGSMFGGPPGGIKAPPLPVAPEPERKELPSLFGGPSKLAPRPATPSTPPLSAPAPAPSAPAPALAPPPPAPRSDRSKSQTQPAPIVSKPFGPAPGAPNVATVIAEPEPTPASRSFASAPEAKTMAMIDGGFVAGAIAEIRASEARAQAAPVAAVAAEDADGPTTLDPSAMPMFPTAIDLGPGPAPYAEQPTYRQPAEQPTYRAPAGDPTSATFQPGANQPFPSGELLVPAHGTPPGTMPSQEMSLPAHLIGFPSGTYPPAPGYGDWATGAPARRKLPAWVLPVVFTLAIALATGITIAIARAVS